MNADLNTTLYLESLESYPQDKNPDLFAQGALQAFKQEASETTHTLAQQQTAFEEGVNGVREEMATSGSLKAHEQRLQELRQQTQLLKDFQQEQLRLIAAKNAQLQAQTEHLAQGQKELERLSTRATMPRHSPYEDTLTGLQIQLTTYLRDSHDAH